MITSSNHTYAIQQAGIQGGSEKIHVPMLTLAELNIASAPRVTPHAGFPVEELHKHFLDTGQRAHLTMLTNVLPMTVDFRVETLRETKMELFTVTISGYAPNGYTFNDEDSFNAANEWAAEQAGPFLPKHMEVLNAVQAKEARLADHMSQLRRIQEESKRLQSYSMMGSGLDQARLQNSDTWVEYNKAMDNQNTWTPDDGTLDALKHARNFIKWNR